MKKTIVLAAVWVGLTLTMMAQGATVWQPLRNALLQTPLNANGQMITNAAGILGTNGLPLGGGSGGTPALAGAGISITMVNNASNLFTANLGGGAAISLVTNPVTGMITVSVIVTNFDAAGAAAAAQALIQTELGTMVTNNYAAPLSLDGNLSAVLSGGSLLFNANPNYLSYGPNGQINFVNGPGLSGQDPIDLGTDGAARFASGQATISSGGAYTGNIRGTTNYSSTNLVGPIPVTLLTNRPAITTAEFNTKMQNYGFVSTVGAVSYGAGGTGMYQGFAPYGLTAMDDVGEYASIVCLGSINPAMPSEAWISWNDLFADAMWPNGALTIGATNAPISTLTNPVPQPGCLYVFSNTVSGGTVTAGLGFNGPGSGLTGTAPTLNIGGNAATATTATGVPSVLSTEGALSPILMVSGSGGMVYAGLTGGGISNNADLYVPGLVRAAIFSGTGSNLTSLPAAQLVGTLPPTALASGTNSFIAWYPTNNLVNNMVAFWTTNAANGNVTAYLSTNLLAALASGVTINPYPFQVGAATGGTNTCTGTNSTIVIGQMTNVESWGVQGYTNVQFTGANSNLFWRGTNGGWGYDSNGIPTITYSPQTGLGSGSATTTNLLNSILSYCNTEPMTSYGAQWLSPGGLQIMTACTYSAGNIFPVLNFYNQSSASTFLSWQFMAGSTAYGYVNFDKGGYDSPAGMHLDYDGSSQPLYVDYEGTMTAQQLGIGPSVASAGVWLINTNVNNQTLCITNVASHASYQLATNGGFTLPTGGGVIFTQPTAASFNWPEVPAYSATQTNSWVGLWTNGQISVVYSNTSSSYLVKPMATYP